MNIRLLLLALVALAPVAVFAQEAFVPLTSLPGIPDTVTSDTLTDFLNNLYKICIGVAAALAVFQIMHAGVKFMTNKGSISENEQARSLLQGAVFGLILVLSPVILFSIINPKILELNFDTSRLESSFTGVQETTDDGGDFDRVDPEAPYIQYAFRSFVYAPMESNEEARTNPRGWLDTWMDENCSNEVPESLQHLIDGYKRSGPTEEECAAGSPGCYNENRWFAQCEAASVQFKMFERGGTWLPLPDGVSDRVAREFSSGCRRDNGQIRVDRDAIGGCSTEDLRIINEEYGEADVSTRCKQTELLCIQSRN